MGSEGGEERDAADCDGVEWGGGGCMPVAARVRNCRMLLPRAIRQTELQARGC